MTHDDAIDFDLLRRWLNRYAGGGYGGEAVYPRQLLVLLDAVKDMRDQRADDRCWLDADALYAAAGLPPPDRRVGDRFAMLKNCVRYVDQACADGGPWRSYAELEAELAEAVRQRDEARRHLAKLDTEFEALRAERGA